MFRALWSQRTAMSVTVITMANAEQKSIGRIVKKLVMKSEPTIESTTVVSPLPELKYWSSEGSQTTAVSSAEIAEPTSISRQTRLQKLQTLKLLQSTQISRQTPIR